MTAALGVLTLLASGIVAGVLFAVALGVVPAFVALPADRYVEVHKLVGQRYDRVMPALVAGWTVADLMLAAGSTAPLPRVAQLVGAALGVGVVAVSQLGNVPINRRVKALPAGPVAADWADPRARWRVLHLIRTALAGLGFAVNTCALLLLGH